MQFVFGENKKDIVIVVQFSESLDDAMVVLETVCENQDQYVCSVCTEKDSIFGGVKNYLKFGDDGKDVLAYIKSGYVEAFVASFEVPAMTVEDFKSWKANIDEGKEKSVVGGDE